MVKFLMVNVQVFGVRSEVVKVVKVVVFVNVFYMVMVIFMWQVILQVVDKNG